MSFSSRGKELRDESVCATCSQFSVEECIGYDLAEHPAGTKPEQMESSECGGVCRTHSFNSLNQRGERDRAPTPTLPPPPSPMPDNGLPWSCAACGVLGIKQGLP